MRNFSRFNFHFFHERIWKSYVLSIKAITSFILFSLFIFPSTSFGQAGDISQIRNGDGKLHKVQGQDVLDACGNCWVNGNAGASNAHYREGYSIAYRSYLTGLVVDQYYEYELGYDSYHGAMAIDFLTHFQRLEPHGPFGHSAEIIDPLYIELPGGAINFPASPVDQYIIPVPPPSGINSGVFDKLGNAKDVSLQPQTSYNAISEALRKMTMYNGDIVDISYVQPVPSITIGGADVEVRIRVRFKALGTEAVLAWGGHIASRLDWGYTKDNKGKLIPLSAGGISGSPYHMRQKAMYTVDDANGTNPVNLSGFGNQDRSLSAATVFPPPDCPVIPSQTVCAGATNFVFTVPNAPADVTYSWSLGPNTINAVIGTTSATGSSVTIVRGGGGAFTTTGAFTLNTTAVLGAVPQECPAVATGTVYAPSVTATASSTSNTTSAAGCDATLDRTIGNVSNLSATAGGSVANYSYQWSDDNNPNGNFSNAAIAAPQYSVTASGTYTVKVVTTDGFGCTASRTLTICVVGGAPNCSVTGASPICPGTTNVYKYDPDGNGVADPIPTNFSALWEFVSNTNGASISGSATGNTVTVVSSTGNCNSAYTIKITLTSTSGLITSSCQKAVSVVDQTAPVLSGCPDNVTVDFCSIPAPAPVTATDNCPAPGTQILVTFQESKSNGQNGCSNIITRKWTAVDACGNTATCGQTITVVDKDAPKISCPPSVTIKFADNKDDLSKTGAAFASDNCAIAAGYPQYTDGAGSLSSGTFTRTWRVQDASGNTASCSQSITREAEPVVQQNRSIIQTEVSAVRISQPSPELKVKAYPNPFTDQVNFRFTPSKSGMAKMEMFDMTGRRLSSVQIGYVQAGIERSYNYRVPALKRVSMFYRISISDQAGQGLLLSGSKSQ